MSEAGQVAPATKTSPLEVFLVFLRLGCTSFGGPIAHLGYFRDTFVVRRRWIDEAAYADVVALCQFLPGPASSQVGISLGLLRAGPLGALAAWVGFTLPSAVLMTVLGLGASSLKTAPFQGAIHGLKLVAVAVVAEAVFGMARSLTPDARRAAIAAVALMATTLLPASFGQIGAIAFGVLAGLAWCRDGTVCVADEGAGPPLSRRFAFGALAVYLLLLTGGLLVATPASAPAIAMASGFYRSGALVFGGGHVVLPLLKAAVVDPGWMSTDRFLAGYGAAQAMPGPLFTFAAYLGAGMPAPFGGVPGALTALTAIFLPGVLALFAALPYWHALRRNPTAQAAMRGANAAVVGILAAALYNPLWISTILQPLDFALAAVGFVLLVALRTPPLAIVALGVAVGLLGI